MPVVNLIKRLIYWKDSNESIEIDSNFDHFNSVQMNDRVSQGECLLH